MVPAPSIELLYLLKILSLLKTLYLKYYSQHYSSISSLIFVLGAREYDVTIEL